MKKLMTMIAAVATAFGLYADVATGTGFEGSTGGALSSVLGDLTELDDGATKANYWVGADALTAEEASVVMYQGDEYTSDFPSQFDTAGDWYLNLKTGEKTLTRYYTDGKAPQDVTAGNQFFDSVVKLTGFDEDPTIDADAKLAVWLSAIDADATASPAVVGETNLYVSVNGTKYNCGEASALLDQWARLTIKAMPIAEGKIGFVVFVEQEAVSCAALDYTGMTLTDTADVYAKAKQLFPLADGTTVESVSFKGIGSVDDLVFTDQAPDFAKDTDFFTIGWDAGVASVTCSKLSFSTNGLTAEGTAKVVLPETATIEAGDITATFAADKMLDAITIAQDGKSASIASKTAGAVLTINDVATKYATAAEAIAELNDAEKYLEPIQATLKLAQPADAIVLENANIELTLDLAGQTITQGDEDVAAVMVSGPLTIQDSVGTGALAGNGLTEGDYTSCAIQAWGVDCVITGGQINGYVGADQLTISGENTKIEIATNTDMDQDENITVLPEGKALVDNGEGYWIVGEPKVYVAKIGDDKYESLQAALDAAAANAVIEVLANIDDVDITVSKKVTINGGSFTLTGKAATYAIKIVTGGDLTIAGGSYLTEAETTQSLFLVGNDASVEGGTDASGSLTISAGTFGGAKVGNLVKVSKGSANFSGGIFNVSKSRGIKADGPNAMVYVDGAQINADGMVAFAADQGGQITIDGGSITGTIQLEGNSDASTITIADGTIDGEILRKSGTAKGTITIPGDSKATFDRDQTTWCAEGYKTKNVSGDRFSVVAIQYATYKVTTDAGVESSVVSNATAEVAAGARFDIDETVTLTVYPTLKANYELVTDECVLTATLTEAKEYELKVVTKAAAPVIPPVAPGGAPVEVNAEDVDKVVITATAPTGSGITDEAYTAYFSKSVVDIGEGKVRVSAVLDETKIEFAESVEDLGEEVSKIAAGAESATIAAKPGLYYYVEESADVKTIAEPERDRVMATGNEVTVPTTKFDGSGFYRLKCSTTQRGVVTGGQD